MTSDIQRCPGKHVIIELKRPEVKANDYDLMRQVEKYEIAMRKELDRLDERNYSIQIICIVGEELRQWTDPIRRTKSIESLADRDMRVVLYRNLIKEVSPDLSGIFRQKTAGREPLRTHQKY